MKRSRFAPPSLAPVPLLGTFYLITAGVFSLFLTAQRRPSDDWSGARLLILVLFMPSLVTYYLQLGVAPWFGMVSRWRLRRLPGARVAPQPPVSVLIPAFNEEVGIASTVRSVLASTNATSRSSSSTTVPPRAPRA